MNISSTLFVISAGNYLHYKQMKIIIIGGVAGGATTAARIRRVDETAEIILLEKGKYISYANCGLPYYIGGVIEERDKLFVQTPEAFSTRFRVDVRTENEAIFIDRKRKTVTIRQSSEDTYEESYDKLVISTGASPVRPPLPGIDLSGIFTLRNVTDTDRIKEYIKSHAPRKAVIVGAGFIGLEMAENLHTQDLPDLLFQFFETDIHFCFLYGTTNERDNLVIIISFRYIIKRTVFDSLHPVGNIAVSSKKNHFHIGSYFFDIQNQIHSVSIRKKNIT
jgi:hypothetical protein